MKQVRFRKFDGSILLLVILLCFFLFPGIIYWAVKRRDFLFDVISEADLVDRLEQFHELVKKGMLDDIQYEKKRDRLVKLSKRANKAADRRKADKKLLVKYQNKLAALEYIIKSAEKIDIIGLKSFDKALKRL